MGVLGLVGIGVLLVGAVSDFLRRIIPDTCSIILVVLWVIRGAEVGFGEAGWWLDLLVATGLFLVLVLLAAKGGLGGGDIKFLSSTALFMGVGDLYFLVWVGVFSVPLWFITLAQGRMRAYLKHRKFHWRWQLRRMRLPYGVAIGAGAIYQLLG